MTGSVRFIPAFKKKTLGTKVCMRKGNKGVSVSSPGCKDSEIGNVENIPASELQLKKILW